LISIVQTTFFNYLYPLVTQNGVNAANIVETKAILESSNTTAYYHE